MPAERRAGTVFGDERLLERGRRHDDTACDLVALRLEKRRRRRRLAEAIGREVVAVAEIGDAPARGVRLVFGFLELELADCAEQGALFLDGDEVRLENESLGQRRRAAEEFHLLRLHRQIATRKATPSAATENAAATAVKTSTRRSRASATCAAVSSALTVFASCAASSLLCDACCDTAACSSAICCCTRSGGLAAISGLRLVNAGLVADRMSPTCGMTALRAAASQLAIRL